MIRNVKIASLAKLMSSDFSLATPLGINGSPSRDFGSGFGVKFRIRRSNEELMPNGMHGNNGIPLEFANNVGSAEI